MYTCIIKAITNPAATTIAILMHEFCHALLVSHDDKCLANCFVKLLKCEKHCIHDGWPMS